MEEQNGRKIRCPDCGHILGVIETNGDFVARRKGRVVRLIHTEDAEMRVKITCECGRECECREGGNAQTAEH